MNQLPTIRKRMKRQIRLHEAQILASIRVRSREVKQPIT